MWSFLLDTSSEQDTECDSGCVFVFFFDFERLKVITKSVIVMVS